MISQELAELAGLFAADGCMQQTNRGGYVCFWGNITEDRPYYDNHIAKLFKKEFGIAPRLHEKKSNSVYGFYCCSKDVIGRFQELGFHVGKKTYTVQVPPQVIGSGNPEIWAAFIRGFFDGDGCISFLKRKGPTNSLFHLTHHTYPRLFLDSRSFILLHQLHALLLNLGIHARCYFRKPCYVWERPALRICVFGAPALERWMQKIGIANPAQLSRYLLWKKQGFCPPRTTLQQRLTAVHS